MILDIGEKYNKLTVLEIVLGKNSDTHQAKCICDCGNICIRSARSVKRGRAKSCGCLLKEYHQSAALKERLIKLAPIAAAKNKLDSGIAAFNQLYQDYKKKAEERNLIFNLTKEEFKQLTKGNCYYCNIIPNQKAGSGRNNGLFMYNGIDRLNNDNGYFVGNCVSCCGLCNRTKNDLSIDEFLSLIKTIYNRLLKE